MNPKKGRQLRFVPNTCNKLSANGLCLAVVAIKVWEAPRDDKIHEEGEEEEEGERERERESEREREGG